MESSLQICFEDYPTFQKHKVSFSIKADLAESFLQETLSPMFTNIPKTPNEKVGCSVNKYSNFV